jgi:transaldolase
LAELQSRNASVEIKLIPANAQAALQTEGITPLKLDESSFRLQLNNDAMATEKLAEGIRNFCVDTEKLEALLAK